VKTRLNVEIEELKYSKNTNIKTQH